MLESLAEYHPLLPTITGAVALVLVAVVADLIARRFMLSAVTKGVRKTRLNWDDALVGSKVFHRLAWVLPALVLYAGIQTSREVRRKESAILRTIGLKRQQLFMAVGVEFMLLGTLAGLLAGLCATLIGWFISTELFELAYRPNPWIWLIGCAGGGLGIGAAGLVATYPLVVRPPLHVLRQG